MPQPTVDPDPFQRHYEISESQAGTWDEYRYDRPTNLVPNFVRLAENLFAEPNAIVAFPASSSFICYRRTEILPFALPRSITSANFLTLRRRSIVRVVTPNQAAISSSVHWSPQSFSNSARSIPAIVPRRAILRVSINFLNPTTYFENSAAIALRIRTIGMTATSHN
jgi:hypothetical protein